LSSSPIVLKEILLDTYQGGGKIKGHKISVQTAIVCVLFMFVLGKGGVERLF
jgi:hypothetical protein